MMGDDVISISDFGWFLVLVAIHAVLVATEFALVRSAPSRFRTGEGRTLFGGRSSLALLERLDLSLSAIQLGTSIVSILLGWWGERTFYKLITPIFTAVTGAAETGVMHVVSTVLALVLVLVVHVVFGELSAKTIAVRHPEGTLRLLSGIILPYARISQPLLHVLNKLSAFFMRGIGVIESAGEEVPTPGPDKSLVVEAALEEGGLDKEEEQMLRGVFGLADTVAREVMTPRTDVVTISVDSTLEEAVQLVLESGHSRFPVRGRDVDDILGIFLARDLLRFLAKSGRALEHARSTEQSRSNEQRSAELNIRQLMREPFFVPATKPADDLLSEMKRRKVHLAVVLDEHGGMSGVVTLEDLLEEIVGEIFDESDLAERAVVVQENGDVIIDGGELVADINSQFDLDIPEGDYDTIAGFIFTSLGRMPRPGDSVVVAKAATFHPVEEIVEATPTPASDEEQEPDGEQYAFPNGNGDPAATLASKVLITVEKVQSHRIETVRLRPQVSDEELESISPNPPSEQRGFPLESSSKLSERNDF